MPDEETASDTLRDLADEVAEMFVGQRDPLDEDRVLDLCEAARATAAERDRWRGMAQRAEKGDLSKPEAIEVERSKWVDRLNSAFDKHEVLEKRLEEVKAERDEARADLETAIDALEESLVTDTRCFVEGCNLREGGHDEDCVLREVEQGDTAAPIRRDTLEDLGAADLREEEVERAISLWKTVCMETGLTTHEVKDYVRENAPEVAQLWAEGDDPEGETDA